MKLHEYQGKNILKDYGLSVPKGRVVFHPVEAWQFSQDNGLPVILKAQVLAGGRGKAGGVKKCSDHDSVFECSEQMLNSSLRTVQTKGVDIEINKLLAEECIDIRNEIYLSVIIDRITGCPLIVASSEGGVEIEETARTSPDRIISIMIDPNLGYSTFHTLELIKKLKLDIDLNRFHKAVSTLFRIFTEKECLVIEINPMVITGKGEIVFVDVKIDIDDNSMFRNQELLNIGDFSGENIKELKARANGLNFIKLKGNLGCMVNGAGLAMATMDVVKLAGAEPANFLDVGGVATPETIGAGFEILLSEPDLKAIFVNIFGGIVRCDRVAKGIVDAAEKLSIDKPVIIRLSGSNVKEGIEILNKSKLKFKLAPNVDKAAEFIRDIVKELAAKEGK